MRTYVRAAGSSVTHSRVYYFFLDCQLLYEIEWLRTAELNFLYLQTDHKRGKDIEYASPKPCSAFGAMRAVMVFRIDWLYACQASELLFWA
jgi:hypothetical protein